VPTAPYQVSPTLQSPLQTPPTALLLFHRS
jgi:hypothetical protein